MNRFIKNNFLLFTGIYILCLISFLTPAQNLGENNAPVVEIIKPNRIEKLKWDALIPYSINVIDVEDGNSAYEEIANLEVILVSKYLEDSSVASGYLDNIDQELEPLFAMSKSTCLSCHAATGKLIGPSFDLIAKRYNDQQNARSYLIGKVIAGGSGIWGDVPMLPHPDLSQQEAGLLIDWILRQTDNPTRFYIGISGAIRTEAAQSSTDKSVYVLTAAYQDHAIPADPNSKKHGIHSIKIMIGK